MDEEREARHLTIGGRAVSILPAQSYWYATIDRKEMSTPHLRRRRFPTAESAEYAAQIAIEQRQARQSCK